MSKVKRKIQSSDETLNADDERWKEKKIRLFDLKEDEMTLILDLLDYKSIMNLFLTCKTIEDFLKNHPRIYKKFLLTLAPSHLVCHKTFLENMTRRFSALRMFAFVLHSQDTPCQLLPLLTKVGQDLLHLELGFCSLDRKYFVKILKKMKNLREMKLQKVTFLLYQDEDEENLSYDPPNLRKLELSDLDGPEILLEALPTTSLHHLIFSGIKKDWSVYENFLFRQKQLKSLEFEGTEISNFQNYEPIFSLQELRIKKLWFDQQKSFENFTNFIKNQQSISRLFLEVNDNFMDYSNILQHLLRLESLNTLDFCFHDHLKILEGLEITNPNLKLLTLHHGGPETNYSSYFQSFPNIKTLNLLPYPQTVPARQVQALTNLKCLEEINFTQLTVEMMQNLRMPQLKRTSIKIYISSEDPPEIWRDFVKENPNIEKLELIVSSPNGRVMRHIKSITENFTKLKYFKFLQTRDFDEEVIKSIGKNIVNLKYLQFQLDYSKKDEAINIFKEFLPNFHWNFDLECGYWVVKMRRQNS